NLPILYHPSFLSSYSLVLSLPQLSLFPYTTLFRSATVPQAFRVACAFADVFDSCIRCSARQHRDGQRLQRQPVRRSRDRADLLRSEEHTSELQSPDHLVCRVLLEKKKKTQ